MLLLHPEDVNEQTITIDRALNCDFQNKRKTPIRVQSKADREFGVLFR